MSWLDSKNFNDNRTTAEIKREFKIWLLIMVLLVLFL
jgi:hypothetical protein